MGLTATMLAYDATGRIRHSDLPAASFNGGTPMDASSVLAAYMPAVSDFESMWVSATNGTLSNGNRTITQVSGLSPLEARSTKKIPASGKWYWEVSVTKGTNPSPDGVGLIADVPIAGNAVAMARGNGSLALVAGGITSATQVNWGATYTLKFAYDIAGGKLWVGNASVSPWFSSGDPVAGTNPYYANISSAVRYYVGLYGDNNAAAGATTLRSDAATAINTPPAGFSFLTPAAMELLAAGDINVSCSGAPYDTNSALVVEVGAPVGFSNGLPITASGKVAISTTGAITTYNAGLPYTATGALAFAP